MDIELRAGRHARCHRSGGVLALAMACGLILAAATARADTLRCGSKVIKDGDSQERVLEYCGEPVKRERTWIQRQPQYELGGRDYSFPGREDVPVDLWTYDFGPNKLMQRIRFIDGKVQTITTLDRGTAK